MRERVGDVSQEAVCRGWIVGNSWYWLRLCCIPEECTCEYTNNGNQQNELQRYGRHSLEEDHVVVDAE